MCRATVISERQFHNCVAIGVIVAIATIVVDGIAVNIDFAAPYIIFALIIGNVNSWPEIKVNNMLNFFWLSAILWTGASESSSTWHRFGEQLGGH